MHQADLDQDLKIFTILENEDEEQCEYDSCDLPRTHLLVCSRCRASENICEAHAAKAKAAPRNERVIFNRSCQHTVLMFTCGKVRVK
jgi:hypothetical protein